MALRLAHARLRLAAWPKREDLVRNDELSDLSHLRE